MSQALKAQMARDTPAWMSIHRVAEVGAEFLGTSLFLFFAVSSVVNWGGTHLEPMGIAATFGGSIMVLVSAFGDVSGAHFNCAVTLGLLTNGTIDAVKALQYIIAQVSGAAVGASLARACAKDYMFSGKAMNIIGNGYTDLQVFGAEAVGTLLLVVTVIQITSVRRCAIFPQLKPLAPIAIGGAVFIAHLALAPVDGCSINPARSLGTAIAARKIAPSGSWGKMWIFCVAPALGGIVAGAYDRAWRKMVTNRRVEIFDEAT